LTRLRWAAALLACLALAACETEPPANVGPGRAATIAVPPARGCDLQRFAVAHIAHSPVGWIVPVTVDGSPLRLIVDTGAERSLLTEAVVARLRLQRDPAHSTRTFGIGGLSTTEDARVGSFVVGGTGLPVPSVTVGPFTLPADSQGPPDGLLGADVLSAFDVDIDAREGVLTLFRARNCPESGPPWQEAYLSLGDIRRARDRLIMPIVLDDISGIATFDTGAQRTAVSERIAQRAGVTEGEIAQDQTITAHGVSAGQVAVHMHRFRLLRIGPLGIQNPLLPVLPIPNGAGDALIGADLFAGRRIWLSYASLRVFVTVQRGPQQPVALR